MLYSFILKLNLTKKKDTYQIMLENYKINYFGFGVRFLTSPYDFIFILFLNIFSFLIYQSIAHFNFHSISQSAPHFHVFFLFFIYQSAAHLHNRARGRIFKFSFFFHIRLRKPLKKQKAANLFKVSKA